MTPPCPPLPFKGRDRVGMGFLNDSIMKREVYIAGTGSYLPDEVVTNEDLAGTTGLSPEEIEKMTGIKMRRRARPEAATSDLATHAALSALGSAGLEAKDVGLIILSTTSPDMPFPATACIVQKNISAGKAFAFDVNASCSGFLYALSIAETFLKNGMADTALVIASEIKSKFVDPKDRETAILFGDGAGAVVLRSTNPSFSPFSKWGVRGVKGIIRTSLHADGKNWSWIHLPAGGSKIPATPSTVASRLHTMRMEGSKVYKAAIKTLGALLPDFIKESGYRMEDIDLFLLHQANLRILRQVIHRAGIPEEKVPLSLIQNGNTSSASIPITLDQAVNEGRLKEGNLIAMASFGGGLTWGMSVVRW